MGYKILQHLEITDVEALFLKWDLDFFLWIFVNFCGQRPKKLKFSQKYLS